uniref:Thyroglobulin type-1 domain-containing protein n=1 Tax=Gadus morhua TaxID=8049 RepID=A0A8C5CGN8_GADMO
VTPRERPDFRLLTPVVIRSYVPTCDDDGNFTPMQCSGSKGYCWCVNIYTGVEIPRPRTPPGKMPPRCGECRYPLTTLSPWLPPSTTTLSPWLPPSPPPCYNGYRLHHHLLTIVSPTTST